MKQLIYICAEREINGDASTNLITYDLQEARAAARQTIYHLTEREREKRIVSVEGYEVYSDAKTAKEAWDEYVDEATCEDPVHYEKITSDREEEE